MFKLTKKFLSVLQFYKSGKSPEIYSYIFAHRGFHFGYGENTLSAFNAAINKLKQGISNIAIETDLRMLRDGTIICFHDRYGMRLLGEPGKIANMTYAHICSCKIHGKEKIPTLRELLSLVDSKIPLLLEIKGSFNKKFEEQLLKALKTYRGQVYFHTKNLIAYKRARKIWHEKVFFILNPIRKRFNFIKGSDYAELESLCVLNDSFYKIKNERKVVGNIPDFEDVFAEIEGIPTVQKMMSCCYRVFNKRESRVNENHWLSKYLIAHRMLPCTDCKEHSIYGIEYCKTHNIAMEFDIVMYKDELLLYHSDKISDKLGQPKSCGIKNSLDEAMTFEQVLKLVGGKVPLIIDIKDARFWHRKMQRKMMTYLQNYKGIYVVQSFNPRVVMWFEKHYPEIIRGQVGHTANGLFRINQANRVILPIINFALFYYGHPDFITYNMDTRVKNLSKFNNIIGRPVILYAPKTIQEAEPFNGYCINFIGEGEYIQSKLKKYNIFET